MGNTSPEIWILVAFSHPLFSLRGLTEDAIQSQQSSCACPVTEGFEIPNIDNPRLKMLFIF